MEENKLKKEAQRQTDYFNEEVGDLPYYDCPICKNKGVVGVVIESNGMFYSTVKECSCASKRKVISMANTSGLGEYINKRFNDYVATEDWQKTIKNKAIKYCKADDESWFISFGQSGSGKTLISTIIANYLLFEKNKKVLYIVWTDFISKLKRDMMGDNTNEVSNYLEEVKCIEVLYIDELLKKYNEADLKYLIEIINYRYTNNLKTIISSEKNIEELLNIDEATFGRVIEKANEYIVNIPKDRNKNYRLRGIL